MTFSRKNTLAIAFLTCLLAVALALPAQALAKGKIGVVDTERAVNNTKAGKRAQAELKRKLEKYQQEIKGLQVKFQKLQSELENSSMLLKPEAKLSKQRELERLGRQIRDRQRDAQQDWAEAQRQAYAPILAKMKKIIEDIGKKGGYSLIMETRFAIYYPKSADITPQVIAAYDKVNP